MNKILILCMFTLTIASISSAQFVNIPDTAFLHALIDEGVDTSGDGEISYIEAEAMTSLNVSWSEIYDMTGIEAFTNLDTLSCTSNSITNLNVSGSPNLGALYCRSNHMTSLDISGCTALKELDCADNKLTSLDVSNNTELLILNCCVNQLYSLDVSNNTSLVYLDCGHNQITWLDVSSNTALTELYCREIQIINLDLSGNNSLIYVDCSSSQLASLNVSGCTALKELYCNSTQLTSLDLSGYTALEVLWCRWSQLTSLNVNGCSALNALVCTGNQLTSLNISTNTALKTVDLGLMTTLYDVCVWVVPFPPTGVKAYTEGSPNVNYTTDCSVNISGYNKEYGTLNIYPNPSSDIINIEIENPNNATIEIYNFSGRLVFSKALNSEVEKIDISGFSEGIYFIKVRQEQNVNIEKLIVY